MTRASCEVAHVELMEQGGCNVVQGNTVNQRAAYVRRLAAVGLTLLAAAVVLAALVGGSTPEANQLAISKLYSATGWDSIYGGASGSSTNSDAWHDSSGSDDTGARTNILHEDGDSDSDSDDTDPDSAKNDVHWNAAGGSTSKTAVSDDDSSADDSASVGQAKMAKASASSGSGQKAAKATVAAKKGKPDTTDALIKLSQSFDKGMPQPKTRAEEKKQKAEQLANLLRIQKELSSDYKKVMAKGTSIKSVGKKMGLMNKAQQTARLGGDPFDV